MSNAQKFLLGAVGLIVTVLLAAVIINIMNKGRSSMNNSMDSYDAMVGQFEDVKFSVYRDSNVTGNEVINLLKNLNVSDNVSVIVKSKAGATCTWTAAAGGSVTAAITGGSATTGTLSDVGTKAHDAYINALGAYKGSVQTNANGAILSVTFEQK